MDIHGYMPYDGKYGFLKYILYIMKLPFILLMDMDQTIIGDVNLVIQEFNLLNDIYKKCVATTKSFPNTCKVVGNIFDIQDEMKNGLLRPHCKEFLEFCKKKFKTLEVFIYTNSSHTWARTGIVPQIEKALGIKVRRPIFTRIYSINDTTKTVANIATDIHKTLVKKYPAISNKDTFAKVLNERFIFIDDTKDNLYDHTNRQIVCPEYNFSPYYDIYEKLINKYKIAPTVFDNKELLEKLYMYEIPVYNKNGSIYQQNKDLVDLWRLYLSKIREIKKENAPYEGDTFFLDIIKIFEKIEDFTDKEIKNINKKIAKST
jgi:hypothetical protein